MATLMPLSQGSGGTLTGMAEFFKTKDRDVQWLRLILRALLLLMR